jgi:hypothetical protein
LELGIGRRKLALVRLFDVGRHRATQYQIDHMVRI